LSRSVVPIGVGVFERETGSGAPFFNIFILTLAASLPKCDFYASDQLKNHFVNENTYMARCMSWDITYTESSFDRKNQISKYLRNHN